MEKVKLGDVATYINGYAFKPTDWSNEGVLIIRIQDLTGNSYQANRYNGNYEKKYEIQKGDVLISWSASLGVYVWQGETAVLNQHIFKVLFDKVEIDKNFFVHQVECILKNASSEAHGATMKHLTKPVFDALPFYLPSLEEQKAIAERLDKVSGLIEKRKTQLEKLDLLIKSRFIEIMESAELSDELTVEQITERVKVGFVGTCEKYYTDETGIPMLRTGNITDCGIDMRDLKYVTADFHKKNKKSQIRKGDLLIARHGSNGQANVYDGPEAQCLNAVVVVPNQSVARSMFLAGLINSSAVKRQIDKTLVGSTQHVVNTKSIANLIVRIPDLEVQKQYENFVEQTDKSKFEIQKSLEKLEILKKSLMQQYFG